MFCWQDNKLYLVAEKELVGVSVTPTATVTEKEKTKYKNGSFLTFHEVKCAFGIYDGKSYKYPVPAPPAQPQEPVEQPQEVKTSKK